MAPADEIVPPRPNPGPEPWSEPPGRIGVLAPWLAAVALLVVLAWWRLARRRRARAGAPAEAAGEVAAEAVRSPRLRLIAASESVRLALIAAQGAGWGSKTTEEIAADPELAARLGADRASGLVGFLRLADRAKFAGEEPAEGETDAALAWAASFAEGLAAEAAGATSSRNGRWSDPKKGPRRRSTTARSGERKA